MLDSWALQQKRLKKALYAALVETRTLRQAACLRALTVNEVDDYRRLGLSNPIAIVPNGIGLPAGVNANLFWQTYPQLVGKRVVLFLGRLHQKKGLHLLVQAWAKLKRQADDAHLVIAGPDSDNMRVSLEQLTTELKLRSSITFAGMLIGERKWSALAAAKLFVLPSYSEGFSMAVLEALAMGIPVVVTVPCHVPEVTDHDCGWVIPSALTGLEGALEEFLQLSPAEASRMGERGRGLARQRFHWSVVGKQMAEVYHWLQGGSKPTTAEIA
jgi:glycosyltransferase involved in cell wall biosynthesis